MRLTLRTLLAYLDNVFEPEDAAILKKKIEESDFAKTLVQRIRSASTRRRLGAPNILGRGIGADPNTVAQYLDSTLPPDRVPDLERICLESDVHLAEVAACHQILTLVLTEAIDVEPDLRQRMYEIGAPKAKVQSPATALPADDYQLPPAPPADSPPVSPTVQAGSGAMPPAPPVPGDDPLGSPVTPVPKPHSELPEYLKAGQRGLWKPLAITLVVAFLSSAMILRAFGPFNAKHPILRLFGGGGTEVASVSDGSQADDDESTTASGDESDSQSGAPVDGSAEGSDSVGNGQPTTDGTEPSTSGGSVPATTPGGEGETTVPPSEPPVSPTPGAKTEPTIEFPETKPEIPPVVATGTGSEEVPETTEKPAPIGPSAAVEVGYVKTKDLHFPLRLDPASNRWDRLPSRSKLMSGDRLRVLPTYQPELVLAPGVQFMFAGPSDVELQTPTANGEPAIGIEYVRAFISTAGVPGAKLHLRMGERSCVVTFVDPASELALEVRRFLPPGANPEQGPTQQVARVFVTIGRIEWQDSVDASPATITESQVRVLVDDKAETLAASDIPSWVLGENLREIDRGASTTLESYLVAERPITLSLKERLQDRRMEIRALAAICLSYLGSFEGIAKELNDSRQRSYWAVEFEALRNAISRSPETAAQVHMILGTLYPNEADLAYRLLAGYGPQELHDGADQFLVDTLESDSLPLRILAFENLRRITDLTLFYRPYVTDELRRSSVRGWRDRLEGQGVIYDTLPVPTSNRW